MKTFKTAFLAFIFVAFIAAPVFTLVSPQPTYAVTDVKDCEKTILGIHPWFRGLVYLNDEGKCTIASPGATDASAPKYDVPGFIWRVALNVVEIALAAVGYIAFFFVLFGGFQFLTGGNNPSQIEKARKTILNAVIGLVISIAAVTVVNIVFGIIG